MFSSQLQARQLISHLLLAAVGSIVVLGALFYAVSQAEHDINPSRLLELVKSSPISFLVLYLIVVVIGLLLRSWRYLILLKATGDDQIPNYSDLTLITAVRNMTVDLLPSRLGELVFVALLRKRSGTKVSSGLTTLLYATLLDIVVLAPVTIGIGVWIGFPNKQPYLLALIALAAAVSVVMGVRFILPLMRGRFLRLASHRNVIVRKFFEFVAAVDEAMQATLRAGVLGKVLALSVLVRIFKYTGLLLLFYGLTRQSFPLLADLDALKVLGSMIASEITASLPIPTLMSFGTWELGGMTLLAYFGAIPQQALLSLLAIHVQSQAVDYAMGTVALAALLLFNGKVESMGRAPRWRTGISVLFVVLALAFSWFGFKSMQSKSAQQQMLTQGAVVRPSDAPLPAWIAPLEGFIAWSSNRSGNHDIWLMSLPDLRIRQLTTHAHTENFASISPDGKKVVFSRSHKAWESVRNDRPWDVWMIDIASGKETRLAQFGVSPTWSPDGSFVTFQRDPGMIMAVDIQSGKERLHYESGKDEFMSSRVNLNTPSIGEGLRLAFTYRDRGRPTNVVRDQYGVFETVHSGACQVQWMPSGDEIIYIQGGGRQKNQIMHYDPVSKAKTTLLDLPGEYSHEYFARLSADEKMMVLAASSGGHEHDLADYELFLWPLGADASEAVRLTFNSGNDSWPDIWLR